jgi:hypothetical protein
VVDPDLGEGVQQPLGQLGRVALAVLGGEAVAGIAPPVGEVQVGDVAEADDGGLRGWRREVADDPTAGETGC